MKKIYLVLVLIISLNSCSDSDETPQILMGSFTEISPVKERVQLEFTSENQLIVILSDVSIRSSFTIKLIDNNELELSCNECDEEAPQIVSYRVIDNNSFEISGIYPAESNVLMTFQRN